MFKCLEILYKMQCNEAEAYLEPSRTSKMELFSEIPLRTLFFFGKS